MADPLGDEGLMVVWEEVFEIGAAQNLFRLSVADPEGLKEYKFNYICYDESRAVTVVRNYNFARPFPTPKLEEIGGEDSLLGIDLSSMSSDDLVEKAKELKRGIGSDKPITSLRIEKIKSTSTNSLAGKFCLVAISGSEVLDKVALAQ